MSLKRKIQQYFDQGIDHHRLGNFNEAAKIYKNILNHDHNNPDALNLLGVVSLQTGKPEKAVMLINKAIRQDQDNAGY